MTKITAAEVKQLREKTGVGMMEVKAALLEAGGDEKKALEILRRTTKLKAQKKAGRQTIQGLVDAYIHGQGQLGVLVEVNTETDFVARNQEFKNLIHDLALHIAAQAPLYVSREDVPAEIVEKEREIYAEEAKAEGKPVALTEKIVTGRLEKFYQEICLLEQPFVKNPEITVQELVNKKIAILGENIQVRRFARYVLGE